MQKDCFDYIISIITAIGALIALPLSILSIKKLIIKDQQKQEQINELINQTTELKKYNSLYQKRIRMINKPRIISNSIITGNNDATLIIYNKGETAKIESINLVADSENMFCLNNENTYPALLEKEGNYNFVFHYTENNLPNNYSIVVNYFDLEGYSYVTTFIVNSNSISEQFTRELE